MNGDDFLTTCGIAIRSIINQIIIINITKDREVRLTIPPRHFRNVFGWIRAYTPHSVQILIITSS